MRTKFLALCAVNLIPLLALGGAAISGLLLHSLFTERSRQLGLSSYPPNMWVSILVCTIAGLLCLCIAFWWIAGLIFYYLALARERRSARQIQLPSWAPGLLKTLAGASLGLGSLVPAQAAYALPLEEAISVTAGVYGSETSSPLFPQAYRAADQSGPILEGSTLAATPTPLFDQATEQTVTAAIIPVKARTYQPISPLFGAAAGAPLAPSSGDNQEQEARPLQEQERPQGQEKAQFYRATPEEDPTDTYTVAAGDCLWSIAEKRLPPEASGAEVLALVQAIWQLNQDAIPTLETLIFPGQTLTLPR